MPPGNYRNITGNAALALGLVAAGRARRSCRSSSARTRSRRPRDILHELSKHKRFGVTTMQAEDEIAAVGAALGASYGGALGVTTTSGPGVALKSETISLAVALELPLVIVDVQRAGPSTGMPTKTEQADLNMALFGRHGEAPVAVIAPQLAVGLLLRRDRGGPDRADLPHAGASCSPTATSPTAPSRGCCPTSADLPDLRVEFATEPNGEDGTTFLPYLRDPETLARPWAIPGTPGLEHRIGGLEKADKTGDISYDPANHDFMVRTRAARIEAIEVPDVEVEDPDGDGPGAGARLGLDVRADRRRLPGAAPAGAADRAGAPAAPRPDAGATSATVLARVRQGGHPGDEPRPAGPRDPGAGTWSTRSPTTRSAACRSPPPSWRPCWRKWSRMPEPSP